MEKDNNILSLFLREKEDNFLNAPRLHKLFLSIRKTIKNPKPIIMLFYFIIKDFQLFNTK